MKTVVLHASDVEKALPLTKGKPFTWLYLGEDMAQEQRLSGVLGKENRYPLGEQLQQVAHQEKQRFLDFIAEVGLYQKNKLHWWASNIAYKNPLADDFFLLWCYAALFEKVVQSETDIERLLVVFVQDRWLYRYLWQRHGKDIGFLSRKSMALETVRLCGSGFISRGAFVLRVIGQWWHLRRSHRVPGFDREKKPCYIYSEIGEGSFSHGRQYCDSTFGRLADILAGEPRIILLRLSPLFVPGPLLDKAILSGEFVFLPSYINIWDLLRSILRVFTIDAPPKFTGDEVRVLLRRAVLREFASSNLAGSLLHYFTFRRYFKSWNNDSRGLCVIYPIENQPWERMLCLAAKKTGNNIELVGYQHTSIPPLLLNYFPGAGEASNMPRPNAILTNGRKTLSLLRSAGYDGVKLYNAGALRYEYLHKGGNAPSSVPHSGKSVLVALAYSRSLTEELLLAVFNAFAEPPGETVKFILKPHPWASLESLNIQLPPWPAHFSKTDRPFAEVLKEVDAVIYSSSTIGQEAVLGGVPVIAYHSGHTIELDPLDTVEDPLIRSCTGGNMREVTLAALREPGNFRGPEQRTLGGQALDEIFSQVDDELWRRVVMGDIETGGTR